MDYPGAEVVSYGSLGTASYNTNREEWTFLRDSTSGTSFKIIECDKIFPGVQHNPSESNLPDVPDDFAPARLRARRIDALTRTNPELVVSSSLLPGLEQVSSAVSEVASIHDPLASEHIAYGTFRFENAERISMRIRSRKSLATVTGSSQHIVRLNVIGEDIRNSIHDHENVEFVTDRHFHEHSVFWTGGDKTSILQLSFSVDDGAGSFLAVRRLCSVDILRPTVRQIIQSPSPLTKFDLSTGERILSSHLDPNCIIRVSLESAVNPTIIDFAFNPWIPSHFAILGASGDIELCQIKTREKSHLPWHVLHVSETSTGQDDHQRSIADHWGRLLWTESGSSIAVVKRHALYWFRHIDGELSGRDIDILPPTAFILDLKHNKERKQFLYILTSTSIIIVSCELDEDRQEPRVLFSVPHYRSLDDMTLQLSVGYVRDAICILIYSRISSLITGIRLYFDEASGSIPHPTSPFRFEVPADFLPGCVLKTTDSIGSKLGLVSLCMKSVDFELLNEQPTKSNSEAIPQLLEILMLDQDHSLMRAIVELRSSDQLGSVIELSALDYESFDPFEVYKNYRPSDNFVTEETDSPDYDDCSQVGPGPLPQILNKSSRMSSNNFTFLAGEVEARLLASDAETRSMGSFESSLADILENRNQVGSGVHTLADFLSDRLPVDMIDAVSNKTLELVDSIRSLSGMSNDAVENLEEGQSVPHKLIWNGLLSQRMIETLQYCDQNESILLLPIYEKLLELYLHSLPNGILPQTKVWLERIIRRASMHLFLSSHSVRPLLRQEDLAMKENSEPVFAQADLSQIELPVRSVHARANTFGLRSSSGIQNNEKLVRSASLDSTSGADNILASMSRPGSTLPEFVSFRPPSPLSLKVRNSIAVWHTGARPSGSEWRSISRTTSQDDIQSARRERKKRKEKGRDRITEPTSLTRSQRSQDTNITGASTVMNSRSELNDVTPSQPSSSQVQRHSEERLLGFYSQAVPPSSSRLGTQVSQSHNSRLKKAAARKRPSGFR